MSWLNQSLRALRRLPRQLSLYSSVTPIDNSHLARVPETLFGHPLQPDEMRAATRAALHWDQALYRRGLPGVIRSLLPEALAHQRKTTQQGDRKIYTMPAVPLAHGHAVAAISFAPVDAGAQAELMRQNNLMRFVVASFVGGGAAYTDAQRQQALSGGGGKARPRNIPRPLPTAVVARNAALFRDDAPLQGVHLLGGNSWCTAQMHLMGDDEGMQWQSVAWVTTDIHSQDGTVLWQVVRHPDYPQGLIWLSIHYGDHQVPLGDTINAWLAPFLFHPTYQRAMRVAQDYPLLQQKFGDVAAELLLNPAVAQEVQERERRQEPRRSRQFKILQALDLTGGFLLGSARFLRTSTG